MQIYRTHLTVNDKSVECVFGTRTPRRGGRMEGVDESNELWLHAPPIMGTAVVYYFHLSFPSSILEPSSRESNTRPLGIQLPNHRVL